MDDDLRTALAVTTLDPDSLSTEEVRELQLLAGRLAQRTRRAEQAIETASRHHAKELAWRDKKISDAQWERDARRAEALGVPL